METMLDIQGLTKRFGPVLAVDGVSFKVGRGEVLGFLGPNGAGKSTTMKMVAGYLPPTAGTALVAGYDVVREPLEAKRRVGYLPEGAPAYGDMTPVGLLDFVADIRGLEGNHRKQRLETVIERLQLASVLQRPIETLSKGFKRRVGLAQAILLDPEILILDEPTDGLDPNQKHEVRGLLADMAGEKAIVISTHILEEVEAICSRAIIVAGGRIVADAKPAELKARSRRHNAVSLRIKPDDQGKAQDLLGKLAGVAEVEALANGTAETRLLVYPSDGREILGPVHQALDKAKLPVEEIVLERGRLDEVFRQLTTNG